MSEWKAIRAIELTQGKFTVVDDQDYEFLNQWNWQSAYDPKLDGYYVHRTQHIGMFNGKKKQKTIGMHRQIMEHALGRKLERYEVIDHINNDPLDNRRENLRIASPRQNQQNQKRKTSSKYPGVYWSKQAKKWHAMIKLNGKKKHLGYFVEEREAAKAYEAAVRENCQEELICKTGRNINVKSQWGKLPCFKL